MFPAPRQPYASLLRNCISRTLIYASSAHAAGQSLFGPGANKRFGTVLSCEEKQGNGINMLHDQTAVYDPEDLSRLEKILDETVAALPPAMQTPANRMEIAKIILTRAASGEVALAPLMKFEVGEGS